MDLSQVWKPGSTSTINVIHHINNVKKKNHMIISTDTEKALDEVQYVFMIKTLSKLGMERGFFNLTLSTRNLQLKKKRKKKPAANKILTGKILKAFPLRFRIGQGHSFLTLLFNIRTGSTS